MTDTEKKYSYSLEKLHENILLKSNTSRKKHLDKIVLLQIYVKRRRPIRYNIVSSRDVQSLYYVLVKGTGFRLSPSLDYNFKYYEKHSDCIKAMRKMTNKVINKRKFKFVTDSSYLRIKALEKVSPHLSSPEGEVKGRAMTRSHAARPEQMASDYIQAVSPPSLDNQPPEEEKIVRIL